MKPVLKFAIIIFIAALCLSCLYSWGRDAPCESGGCEADVQFDSADVDIQVEDIPIDSDTGEDSEDIEAGEDTDTGEDADADNDTPDLPPPDCGTAFSWNNVINMCISEEFKINTNTLNQGRTDKFTPDLQIRSLNDDRFVVVWQSYRDAFVKYDILGRVFSSDGNHLGDEKTVNKLDTDNQNNPRIGVLGDSTNFAIVWKSDTWTAANGIDVVGAIFDSNLDPIMSERRVNSYTTSSQIMPEIVVFNSSRFAVVWASKEIANNCWKINGTIFTLNGAEFQNSPEFQINSANISDDSFGAEEFKLVAEPIDPYRFVAVWTNLIELFPNIFGRIIDSQGLPVSSEFLIGAESADSHFLQPELAIFKDSNRFVVIWNRTTDESYSESDLYGTIMASDGDPIKTNFFINSYTTGVQAMPKIGIFDDNRFGVAWLSDQDGEVNIYGAIFDSDGNKKVDDFQVTENPLYAGAFNLYKPRFDLLVLADNRFVVAWASNGRGYDPSLYNIYARIFNSQGEPETSEFIVNMATSHDQINPIIAPMGTANRFIIIWEYLLSEYIPSQEYNGSRNLYGRVFYQP